MAVPCGPQQKPPAKKREATRRATSDGDAEKRQPTQPYAPKPAADDPVKPQAAGPVAADGEANTFVLAHAAADCDAKESSVLPQGPAAARSAGKKRPELAREAGGKQQPGPVQAAADSPLANHCDAKNSPELLEANAAASCCNNSSPPDGGRAKELGAKGAKNCDAPNAAAAASNPGGSSCENRTEFEGDNKKNEAEIGAGNVEASSVWEFIPLPLLQQQRSHKEAEPDFLRKKTSLLSLLFECCGLIDLIIDDKDTNNLHVREKKNLVSETQDHYKIEKSVADKLCKLYSSFRVVLGDSFKGLLRANSL